jgi:ubiquinone/menaquinone biosynthesis C-methylase UbiE
MAELEVVVAEVQRVLRPDGFLQFSTEHPWAVTLQSDWVRDEHGRRVARTIGGYFAGGDADCAAVPASPLPQSKAMNGPDATSRRRHSQALG